MTLDQIASILSHLEEGTDGKHVAVYTAGGHHFKGYIWEHLPGSNLILLDTDVDDYPNLNTSPSFFIDMSSIVAIVGIRDPSKNPIDS